MSGRERRSLKDVLSLFKLQRESDSVRGALVSRSGASNQFLERIMLLAVRQEARPDALKRSRSIHNSRRLGTIAAFGVGNDPRAYMSAAGPRLLSHSGDRDILLGPFGITIYIMPPYCITEDEVDPVYTAIEIGYLRISPRLGTARERYLRIDGA